MKLYSLVKKIRAKLNGKSWLYHQIMDRSTNLRMERHELIGEFKTPPPQLLSIFSGCSDFDVAIYVHGSWADDSKTPFSDLDDLIIINRENLNNNPQEVLRLLRWLEKVEMRFQRLDLTQHHGHWIIYDDCLSNYDESYMPMNVLRGAIRIQGPSTISYSVNTQNTIDGLKRNLDITTNNISRLMKLYVEDRITSYNMKCLIGSFLLIPAYVFQLKGINISKKEAIERKGELFEEDVCKMLDKCSEMRNRWTTVSKKPMFKILFMISFIITDPAIFRKVSQRISPRFPKKDFQIITESEVKKFLDEIYGNS